jgi:multiple sugar transport system substrate-binding protein
VTRGTASNRNRARGVRIIVALAFLATLFATGRTASTHAAPGLAGIPPAPKAIVALTKKVKPIANYHGVKITVAVDAIQTGQPFQWYAPAIKKAFNITVKTVALPFDSLENAIQTDLVSGTGAYDIFVYPPRFTGDLASAGDLVPLDTYEKKWNPNLQAEIPVYRYLYNEWDGKQIALTYDGDRLEVYYRTDLFNNPAEKRAFKKKYGYALAVPQTWKQYLNVAAFFTRKKGATLAGKKLARGFYGTAEITRAPDNFDWWINRFASTGGIYFDKNMNPKIDTAGGVAALQNFKAILPYMPPGKLNFEYNETMNAFLQGESAMVIQWTDVARAAQDPSSSKVVGKVGYAQIPGSEVHGSIIHRSTLAYGRVMGISKLSKNAEAAYRVMDWMQQPSQAINYVTEPTSGIDPYQYVVYQQPQKWVQQWPTLKPYVANGLKSLKNGYPELEIPGAPRYDSSLVTHIANALDGQETPSQALKATTDDWNKITDDLGRTKQTQYWRSELALWKKLGLTK